MSLKSTGPGLAIWLGARALEAVPPIEGVLEQIVDDYLQLEGDFTTHKVRFRPSSDPHVGT
jgi:hypothetical protein